MDESQPPATSPEPPVGDVPTRTILKFDSGRRGFTRAIVTLAVAAGGLLLFAVYFFWRLL
jgi:hypothetical protein